MRIKHNRAAYRSGLEERIATQIERYKIHYEFEPKSGRVNYVRPSTDHTYTPDFVLDLPSGNQIIIETKGIWTYEDRYKHLLIRRQHPDLDIRFIFSRSKSRISKGSKTTYADICEGRGRGVFKGVEWLYADKLIPEEWFEE